MNHSDTKEERGNESRRKRHGRKAAIGLAVCLLVPLLGAGCGGGGDGGGGATGLEFKGLRLGMPAEEAARVMLGHGLPPGGKSDWPNFGSYMDENTMAMEAEYDAALAGIAAEKVQTAMREQGQTSLLAYARQHLPQGGSEWENNAELAGAFKPMLTEEAKQGYVDSLARATAENVRRDAAARGAESLGAYLEATLSPQAMAAVTREGLTEKYSFDNLEEFVETAGGLLSEDVLEGGDTLRSLGYGGGLSVTGDMLARLEAEGHFAVERVPALFEQAAGQIPWMLVPGGAREHKLSDYLAEKYTAGVPYKWGGPWDGTEPLRFEEHEEWLVKLLDTETYGGELLRRADAGSWTLFVDGNGNVAAIALSPGAVDALFNAGDMGAEEFAQSFMDAYGVPEMEPEVYEFDPIRAQITGRYNRSTGWTHTDRENGWDLNILDTKGLTLKRIATSQETAFD